MRTAVVSGRGHGRVAAQSRQAKLYMAPAGTKHPISAKDLENWVEVGLRTPLASWQRNVLGQWAYTPQDELRDRLNAGLRKKDPAPAVNTRFWRGL